MSSDDETIENLNKKIKLLNQKIKKRMKKEMPMASSSDEESDAPDSPDSPVILKKPTNKRPNSDITYEAMINGELKTYKYRTSMLRAKFIAAQRDYYKVYAKEKGIQFINEMYTMLAFYHWKTISKNWIGVEEDNIEEKVDLIDYYLSQPAEVKNEIFRKKPYYKTFLNK